MSVSPLILVCFQVETNYPRPGGQTAETFAVVCQPRQPCLKLGDDPLHGIKDAIGELLFPKLIPDVLLWVEFWRIPRQAVEPDVLRDTQFLGSVRTGSVQNHDEEFVGVRLADLSEELIHPLGVHLRANFPVQFSLERTDRPVNIDKLPFVTIGNLRAQRCWRPAAPNPHHPAKPRLVLKHDPHRPCPNRFGLQQGRQIFREFFFQSSCIRGSLLG